MGHPDGMPFPSRRRLLMGGLGGSIGIPIGRPLNGATGTGDGSLPASDRRLFEDCAAFDRLEVQIQDIQLGLDVCDTRTCDRLQAEQSLRLDRIAGGRATTFRGIRRKTGTLLAWADDLLDPTDLWDRRLIGSILRDLRDFVPGAAA